MPFTVAVEVTASPERAFSYLDDPELLKKWVPGFASIRFDKPGVPRSVGTRFRQRMKGPGLNAECDGEVTAYRPPVEIAILLRGTGFELESGFRLTPESGKTRIECTTRIAIHSWKIRLTGPLGTWWLRRKLEQAMQHLVQVIHMAASPSA